MGHWFHGASGAGADLLADAEAYGLIIPDDMLRASEYEVWPENLEAVQLFLRCQTQWRTGPNGLIGLDYGVALSLAKLGEAADPLALLDDLQAMEMEALDLINKASRKTDGQF